MRSPRSRRFTLAFDPSRARSLFMAASAGVAVAACAPGDPITADGTSGGIGSTTTTATTVSSGGFGPGDGGAGGMGACVADTVEAKLEKKPIDLVLLVDTSGSMAPVSNAVEQNINDNLASILEASGLDYRVIALAGYGSGPLLCVGPPLGGADCSSPPPEPANTARFFQYVVNLGSGGMPGAIVDFYDLPDDSGAAPNGFKDWLRPDSQKVFLIFSDTESASNAVADGDQFDADLLARDPVAFGTPENRAYTLHSIIGLKQSSPATAPWLPSDPIVSGICSGLGDDLGAGKAVQEASILSGGLRFPVCQYSSFDTVFHAIADNVVEHSVIACDIDFPDAPNGGTIDPNTVQIDYTPGDGSPVASLHQVTSAATCEPDAFYITDEVIHLCPDACTELKADSMAQLDVRFGCDVGFVP